MITALVSFSLASLNLQADASFSTNLDAQTVSYLGSDASDEITATEVQSNGNTLISGSFTNLPVANQNFNLNGAII